jgi:AP-2 complex subunit alpha
MQPYAARNVAEVLKRGAAHESLVCTAAYILGEFGRLIAAEVPPMEQYKLLYGVFPPASQPTKGLLMTAFVKIYLMDPHNANLRVEVVGLFERYQKFMDVELQQRSVEYLVGALAARDGPVHAPRQTRAGTHQCRALTLTVWCALILLLGGV